MDSEPEIDPDVLALVTLLCTRIGLIMEDVNLVALTTTAEGMSLRVKQVATASSAINKLASAAAVLMQE